MDEIFVIERMIAPGIWEIMSDTFYTNERRALDDCMNIIKEMQKIDKNFTARVSKLNNRRELEVEIEDFKIVDDGIWIPMSELKRMSEEMYKAALGYDKARKEKKDSAYEAAMLKAQGGAETFRYLYKQIRKEEK